MMKKLSIFLTALLIMTLIVMPNKVLAAGETVRIQETGSLFFTLEDAVTAVNTAGSGTIEIIADVTVAGDISTTGDITIVSAGGAHTITIPSPYSILVQNGALTLGDGTNTDPLTVSSANHSVQVTNGTVQVNDGVTLKSTGGHALHLSGSNVNGAISGGILEGNKRALNIERGAKLSEISGGVLTGQQVAIHLTDDLDEGTKINEISGGSFNQTEVNPILHGHTIFVQNNAQIGKISGGYFQAAGNSSLTIVRGSWVNEISGGTFELQNNSDANRRVIQAADPADNITGIGTISGGDISGGMYGIFLHGSGSQINAITGGTVTSRTVALQNDRDAVITEISGGTFTASQGMLNVGSIGNIGGTAEISGTSSYGIYNYSGGKIDEISGGTIIATATSASAYGISNMGTIKLISGGTIIGGGMNAINCTGMSGSGSIEVISGGVFWGKRGTAIVLGRPLLLEPGLNADKGIGRYWGNNGVIFNNEDLVTYPVNSQTGTQYYMSTQTEPVVGIENVEFKYLRLPTWQLVYDANIPIGANGAGVALPANQTGISTANASAAVGSPTGVPTIAGGTYSFAGWNTQADGGGTSYAATDTVPAQASGTTITLYAQWTYNLITTYSITYNGNGNTGGTAPVDGDSPYTSGSVVTVFDQGSMTRDNYTFQGWAASANGAVVYTPGQTFTITADTTLYAVWTQNPVTPSTSSPSEPSPSTSAPTTSNPKTGNNSDITGWPIALLLCALGMGMLCVLVWRKHHHI